MTGHEIVRVRLDDALTDRIAEALQATFTEGGRGQTWLTRAAAVVAVLQEGAEKP